MPNKQDWLTAIETLISDGIVTSTPKKLKLVCPRFHYKNWEIGTEERCKSVVLQWRKKTTSPPEPASGWKVCPPSDQEKHFCYRVPLLPNQIADLLKQIDALEHDKANQHSNSFCEIWENGGWSKIAVQLAISRPDALIRCQECYGPIQLHRAGPSGVPRAHAEHRVSHAGCSLGHNFDGRRRIHPTPVLDGHDDSSGTIVNEEDESAFPEGTPVYRQHRHLERDGELSRRAKAARLASTGRLSCEVCSIDFQEVYGEHGAGFIEAHHQVPVHQLDGIIKTKLSDLAMVCSNCHRMLHRATPQLTIAELRDLIVERRTK